MQDCFNICQQYISGKTKLQQATPKLEPNTARTKKKTKRDRTKIENQERSRQQKLTWEQSKNLLLIGENMLWISTKDIRRSARDE